MGEEIAMFAAGCFWGVEATFQKLKGILKTEVGYAGGFKENPTYQEICTHTTGHAEVVQIVYDPEQISYDQLLEVFWASHDPTTFHRQGPDVGSQYRSMIFYHNEEQKEKALKSKEDKNLSHYANKISTEIVPATPFYRAEEYHQQYIKKHRGL